MRADGGGPRVGLKAKAGKCWLGAMQVWRREQIGIGKHDVHAWRARASREKKSQQLGHAWELALLGWACYWAKFEGCWFGLAIGPSLRGAILGLQNGSENGPNRQKAQ